MIREACKHISLVVARASKTIFDSLNTNSSTWRQHEDPAATPARSMCWCKRASNLTHEIAISINIPPLERWQVGDPTSRSRWCQDHPAFESRDPGETSAIGSPAKTPGHLSFDQRLAAHHLGPTWSDEPSPALALYSTYHLDLVVTESCFLSCMTCPPPPSRGLVSEALTAVEAAISQVLHISVGRGRFKQSCCK